MGFRRFLKRKSSPRRFPRKRFSTREEVVQYVEAELQRVVPTGWEVTRREKSSLDWTIKKRVIPPGEWFNQEYSLEVFEDFEVFLMTYGNNDVGGFSFHHVVQKAMVIRESALREGPGKTELGDFVHHVMTKCKPNEWGYT